MPKSSPARPGIELQLSAAQCALASGYSGRHMRRLIRKGELGDFYERGGQLWVHMEDFLAWRKAQQVPVLR